MRTVREPQLLAFVLIRLTALLLAILVVGHFAVTHIATDVAETDSGFILRRWSQGLWIAWDATMLITALAHAGCGIWLMIDHGVPTARGRRRLLMATALGIGAVASIGVAALTVGAART